MIVAKLLRIQAVKIMSTTYISIIKYSSPQYLQLAIYSIHVISSIHEE